MAEMKRAEFEKLDGNRSRRMVIEHMQWGDHSGAPQWDQMKETVASGVRVFAGSYIAGIIPAIVIGVFIIAAFIVFMLS